MSLLITLLLPAALAAEPRQLTVDEAMALLEQRSPALASARSRVEQAEGARLVALSSSLPTLSASGSYVRNNAEVELALGDLMSALAALTGQPASSDIPDSIVLQPLDSVSGSLALRVPILSPAAWASAGAAARAIEAGEAGAEATLSTVRGAAWQAFWLESSAEALVVASEAAVERARTLVESAERSQRAGISTRLSVLQAQTELARREGDLVAARGSLVRARLATGALLGLEEPVAVSAGEPSPPASLDPDQLLARAREHRAELRAAEASVDSARASLSSARLGYLPTLSGGFTAFASNVAYSTGEKTGWRASLDLSVPLALGGARVGGAERAAGALHEAEASLASTRLQISQQVQAAASDAEVAVQRLDAANRQLELAEEGARVAQRSFEEGTVDTATVLDALDRLDRARVSAIDARARLGIATVALRTATGEW